MLLSEWHINPKYELWTQMSESCSVWLARDVLKCCCSFLFTECVSQSFVLTAAVLQKTQKQHLHHSSLNRKVSIMFSFRWLFQNPTSQREAIFRTDLKRFQAWKYHPETRGSFVTWNSGVCQLNSNTFTEYLFLFDYCITLLLSSLSSSGAIRAYHAPLWPQQKSQL